MKISSLLALAVFALTIKPASAEVNLRIDPLNTLIGTANVQLDFGIADTWTLGPSIRYIDRTIDDFETSAYGLGIRANYYFNRKVFTQGWYLGPSLGYASAKVKTDDGLGGDLEGTGTGVTAAVIAGYQWMWESFNINLGAGPAYTTIGDITVETDDGNYKEEFDGLSGVDIALEFTLGWKF